MPSMLLVIAAIHLIIHLVNTFGTSGVDELLWILYNKLPTPTSKSAQEQLRLRREVLRLKRQMHATSAQDDFAKWAKIRRQHDKVLSDYEKISSNLSSAKRTFSGTLSTGRLIATNGTKLGIQWWYAKLPMFWMPTGWVPYYAEWMLSFPRAPLGSVSIYIWGLACASVISLVSEAIVALYALAFGQAVDPSKLKAQSEATEAPQEDRRKEL
ncbi:hypothetical protein P152DRAFT_272600 [Eremomyces bilateralis CBS 781.70]|uniref:Uncharacterized protein n=1 Tax=Eremomyces bilateralis CBS 781.70 TaxID=1392243 RepID=A0A6G1G8X2_9PEZI|nr:uncharacterized protein P152DRAFT_272600 [Eremomyces bilateralis CBS 781.70]KAF1814463.1 hypothetical protein P152DRAFT_272600 [Eremomyces bilateralis CBS 781.70]